MAERPTTSSSPQPGATEPAIVRLATAEPATAERTVADRRFLAKYHLRNSADFRRAYDLRCSAADGRLVVYACRNALGHPRVGLSVSRKVGGAVVRNRCRRLLREAFRTAREALPQNVDLVLIPRHGWIEGMAALRDSLVALSRRAAQKLDRLGNRTP